MVYASDEITINRRPKQKLYVRAKNAEEMFTMLKISKKNLEQDKNYFKLGIIFGITIGSICTTLLAIAFITMT